MEKNTAQLLEYAKNIKFGLKNYEATKKKYDSYKKTEREEFLNENIKDLIQSINGQNNNIYSELEREAMRFGTFRRKADKASIREIKTTINSMMYNSNERLIKYYSQDDITDNQIKSFTIKLYLHLYDLINEVMKQTLIEFVTDHILPLNDQR